MSRPVTLLFSTAKKLDSVITEIIFLHKYRGTMKSALSSFTYFNEREALPGVIESATDLSRLIPRELILIDDESTDEATEFTQSVGSRSIDLNKCS